MKIRNLLFKLLSLILYLELKQEWSFWSWSILLFKQRGSDLWPAFFKHCDNAVIHY